MPSRRKSGRRRVRGSDGKLYDPEKQKDNGHRAHENRAQTAARKTRWKARGAAGRAAAGGHRAGGAILGLFEWTIMLFIRSIKAVGGLITGLFSRGGR